MRNLDKEEHREDFYCMLRPYKLTEKELGYIFGHVGMKGLRKGDFFSKAGMVCQHTGLLQQGDLHAHGEDSRGNRRTHKFYHGGVDRIVTSYHSFDVGTASTESIEALNDCRLFVITSLDLTRVMGQLPKLRTVEVSFGF